MWLTVTVNGTEAGYLFIKDHSVPLLWAYPHTKSYGLGCESLPEALEFLAYQTTLLR